MAKGETEPTDQILELSYSRDKQVTMSSSIVQGALWELIRCRERRLGVRAEVRVLAQLERNVCLASSGRACISLPSGFPVKGGAVAGCVFYFERICSPST